MIGCDPDVSQDVVHMHIVDPIFSYEVAYRDLGPTWLLLGGSFLLSESFLCHFGAFTLAIFPDPFCLLEDVRVEIEWFGLRRCGG